METITIIVRVAPTDCWSCGAETYIVSSLMLKRGNASIECGVSDFTKYPQLIAEIADSLRGKISIGALKPRFSRTVGKSYMSNGCAYCDALFGQHFEIHTRYDEQAASEFASPNSHGWGSFLDELLASEDRHIH